MPQTMEGMFPKVHAEVWELMRRFKLEDQIMVEVAKTGMCRVDQFQVKLLVHSMTYMEEVDSGGWLLHEILVQRSWCADQLA